MEVIYSGLQQTPEMIVNTADPGRRRRGGLVDPLGRPHDALPARSRSCSGQAGAVDILVTGGGIIGKEDAAALQAQGVGRLFGPGASTQDAIEYIRAEVRARRARHIV